MPRFIGIVLLALNALGGCVTLILLNIFIRAAFGHADAQWQFVFFLAPLPVGCGIVSLIAYLSANFSFKKTIIAISAANLVVPIILFALSKSHVV
jgi:hypothetical protein